MKNFLVLVYALLVVFPLQASKIQVSGQLNANTLWKADTVIIQGSLEIKDGVVLTIAPGVRVMGGKLEIKGAIQALGKRDSLISFEHQYIPGSNTIYFAGFNFSNIAGSNDSSIINFCKFESLVPNDALFVIRNSNKISIRHCAFDGRQVQGRMLLSAYQSDVKFNSNSIKHFRERAVEFADGNAICSYNIFDSCLNYRYGQDLVYFGAGKQRAFGNIFNHGGDSLNPSNIYPTVIFRNGSECEFRDNKMLNSWNLALRIEDESAPFIVRNQIKNYNSGILLSKTNAAKRVLISSNRIENITETGIYAGIDVRATITSTLIKSCKKGGVTVVRDSDFKFSKDTFINNEGGGCNIQFTTTKAEFTHCYFEGNSANYGGGLFITDRAICKVDACTFVNNLATNGGGLAAGSGSSIFYSTFKDNRAYSFGGGAFVQGCSFTNNRLINNKAYMGGGALFQMSNYFRGTYDNNYIAENTADSLGGGAIIAIDRYMKFRNNHIENNAAGYAGGGLSVYVGSKSWMSGIMINNNEAPFGAGISFEENTSHNLKLSNMSVLYNKSTKKYGAMRNKSKDELYFTNCVFWGNESDNGLDFYSEWDNADPGFDHCVIQGGFSNFDLNGGTFNGPRFKISTDDPNFNSVSKAGFDSLGTYNYYYPNTSNLYNGGKTDTSKLRVATKDLNNTVRIKDSRIDIGAFEFVELPKLEIVVVSTKVCEGGELEIGKTANSKVDYVIWYKNGIELSRSNVLIVNSFTAADSGYYWGVGVNAAGSINSDTFFVKFIPAPEVKIIGADTTLCINSDYFFLSQAELKNYAWRGYVNSKNFNPKKSGPVWLRAADIETGCLGYSDTFDVEIIKPSFVDAIRLGYDSALDEFNITADLQANDGFDSILWMNSTEQWQQFTPVNYLKVEISYGEGDYVANTFLNGCAGDTSQSVTIIWPTVGGLKEFALELSQNNEAITISTDLDHLLDLQLYTVDGKKIGNNQFSNRTAINVANFRNQILLVKVFDAETNKIWIDKIYIN